MRRSPRLGGRSVRRLRGRVRPTPRPRRLALRYRFLPNAARGHRRFSLEYRWLAARTAARARSNWASARRISLPARSRLLFIFISLTDPSPTRPMPCYATPRSGWFSSRICGRSGRKIEISRICAGKLSELFVKLTFWRLRRLERCLY